ncbi:hypothetical protein PEX1_024310 [Penicillium expansum]|uniref:Uncharacterized protein n=1 Tax=Penicillium expansum TaxID=27334 RepID=A0A0A2JEV3_PENEN|nr:hypothetical protein PEX2_024980 [Penicillium expansum]KGO49165.1 hypothetical protein PEXP_012140 [Penicillium expansum]KGO53919.1 hypothetical protein PEX2_024980 [Penicillium expansum]KGO67345.1 hypothetical protein PEX1_024310 [Penicillium expansum]
MCWNLNYNFYFYFPKFQVFKDWNELLDIVIKTGACQKPCKKKPPVPENSSKQRNARPENSKRRRVIYIVPGVRALDSMDEVAPKNSKDQAMCKSKASDDVQ